MVRPFELGFVFRCSVRVLRVVVSHTIRWMGPELLRELESAMRLFHGAVYTNIRDFYFLFAVQAVVGRYGNGAGFD